MFLLRLQLTVVVFVIWQVSKKATNSVPSLLQTDIRLAVPCMRGQLFLKSQRKNLALKFALESLNVRKLSAGFCYYHVRLFFSVPTRKTQLSARVCNGPLIIKVRAQLLGYSEFFERFFSTRTMVWSSFRPSDKTCMKCTIIGAAKSSRVLKIKQCQCWKTFKGMCAVPSTHGNGKEKKKQL